MIFSTAILFSVLSSFGSPLPALPPVDGLPRRGVLGLSFSPLPADQISKYGLKTGEGLVAQKPIVGLSGEKLGVKEGDIIVSLNGKAVAATTIAATIRTIPAGAILRVKLVREGKALDLSGPLIERPRDPGNENFSVSYHDVLSNGKRMRTIISTPRKPGKHPALMFIQGFSPISYDFNLEGPGDLSRIDAPLLFDFANTGFVTMRVEKPGVGDSEGGPFADLDYTTELDIYRQALKQLKTTSSVEVDNIFIFGHSMGGAFGPMIASENPVKGISTYGTAARTWYEYFLDTLRYQGLLAGASFENADETVRVGSRVMGLIFQENQTAEQVKKAHPELAGLTDQLFPGGMFSGKTSDFWRQLARTNFPAYWVKSNTHVFAVHGASDFVSYEVDHKLIADAVNKVHPGWGRWATAPSSDHLFNNYATEFESQKNWPRGTFNMAFTRMLRNWIDDVMKGRA